MSINLIVGLVLFGCILYIGWNMYQNYRKRVLFYGDFLQFCEILETEVAFFQNKINEILQKNEYKSDFSGVLKDFAENKNLEAWAKEQKLLGTQEVDELKNFFAKLGRVDSTTQTKEIQNFKEVLRAKQDEVKKLQQKKGKLVLSLSIMLGLAVLIIIV